MKPDKLGGSILLNGKPYPYAGGCGLALSEGMLKSEGVTPSLDVC